MSRKDYIAAARLIADQIESASPLFERSRIHAASDIARGLADLFAADNPRFDRGRFYFACALDDNGRPDWDALMESVPEPDSRGLYRNWEVIARSASGEYDRLRIFSRNRVPRKTAEREYLRVRGDLWTVTDCQPSPVQPSE